MFFLLWACCFQPHLPVLERKLTPSACYSGSISRDFASLAEGYGYRQRLEPQVLGSYMHAGSPLQMPLPDSMVGTPLDCRASHPTRLNLLYSYTRWSAYLRPCFPEVDAPLRRACIRKYLPH